MVHASTDSSGNSSSSSASMSLLEPMGRIGTWSIKLHASSSLLRSEPSSRRDEDPFGAIPSGTACASAVLNTENASLSGCFTRSSPPSKSKSSSVLNSTCVGSSCTGSVRRVCTALSKDDVPKSVSVSSMPSISGSASPSAATTPVGIC